MVVGQPREYSRIAACCVIWRADLLLHAVQILSPRLAVRLGLSCQAVYVVFECQAIHYKVRKQASTSAAASEAGKARLDVFRSCMLYCTEPQLEKVL